MEVTPKRKNAQLSFSCSRSSAFASIQDCHPGENCRSLVTIHTFLRISLCSQTHPVWQSPGSVANPRSRNAMVKPYMQVPLAFRLGPASCKNAFWTEEETELHPKVICILDMLSASASLILSFKQQQSRISRGQPQRGRCVLGRSFATHSLLAFFRCRSLQVGVGRVGRSRRLGLGAMLRQLMARRGMLEASNLINNRIYIYIHTYTNIQMCIDIYIYIYVCPLPWTRSLPVCPCLSAMGCLLCVCRIS